MPPLPSASILVIARPTAIHADYAAMIDDEHTVDVVQTTAELTAQDIGAYDLVFVDDRHPVIDPAAIDPRLAPGAKITLITDVEPTETIDRVYDDVLVRPLTAKAIEQRIECLRVRQAYVERIDEHFEVATRLAELTADTDEYQGGMEYRALETRLQELQTELAALFERLSSLGEPENLFYDLQPIVAEDSPGRPPAIVN